MTTYPRSSATTFSAALSAFADRLALLQREDQPMTEDDRRACLCALRAFSLLGSRCARPLDGKELPDAIDSLRAWLLEGAPSPDEKQAVSPGDLEPGRQYLFEVDEQAVSGKVQSVEQQLAEIDGEVVVEYDVTITPKGQRHRISFCLYEDARCIPLD